MANRKIAKFRRYSYTEKLANAEQAMMVLRIEMYAHDIDDMAEAIGVSTACLYAIRSGRTKWPRQKTFFWLVNYLGLELQLVKGNG